jgi:hypothetical protein
MENYTTSFIFAHALEVRLVIGVLSVLGGVAVIKTVNFVSAAWNAYVAKLAALRPAAGSLGTANAR